MSQNAPSPFIPEMYAPLMERKLTDQLVLNSLFPAPMRIRGIEIRVNQLLPTNAAMMTDGKNAVIICDKKMMGPRL